MSPSSPRVRKRPAYRNGPKVSVPVEPIREAVIAEGVPFDLIALRAGMFSNGAPDSAWVSRKLGLRPYVEKGVRKTVTHLQLKTALKIMDAANVYPCEVGL